MEKQAVAAHLSCGHHGKQKEKKVRRLQEYNSRWKLDWGEEDSAVVLKCSSSLMRLYRQEGH